MRIGIGYDVHRLVKGRKLMIGGVEIPHEKGLLGHSDADVLLHAIGDALLGAAGLGDLGQFFPDSDPKYKGVSSFVLLKEIASKLSQKKYRPYNVDSVVIAEEPKLAPYRERMMENIANALGIEKDQAHVKATTEEGLGFTGKKEGIAAWAVVLLTRAS